uniref:WW domain-containing protein n=1 Tax=Alexandrium monilatum TaxID=311494 RepID=A0A7S4UXI2_9DINO
MQSGAGQGQGNEYWAAGDGAHAAMVINSLKSGSRCGRMASKRGLFSGMRTGVPTMSVSTMEPSDESSRVGSATSSSSGRSEALALAASARPAPAGRGPQEAAGHSGTSSTTVQTSSRKDLGPWTDHERKEYITALRIVILPGEEPVLQFLSDAIGFAPVPAPWTMRRDQMGRVFFANMVQRATTWSHPLESSLPELAAALRACLTLNQTARIKYIDSLRVFWEEQAKAEFQKWYAVGHASGRPYYFHADTGESMWEHPAEVVLPKHYVKLKSVEWLLGREYWNKITEGQPVVAALEDSPATTLAIAPDTVASRVPSKGDNAMLAKAVLEEELSRTQPKAELQEDLTVTAPKAQAKAVLEEELSRTQPKAVLQEVLTVTAPKAQAKAVLEEEPSRMQPKAVLQDDLAVTAPRTQAKAVLEEGPSRIQPKAVLQDDLAVTAPKTQALRLHPEVEATLLPGSLQSQADAAAELEATVRRPRSAAGRRHAQPGKAEARERGALPEAKTDSGTEGERLGRLLPDSRPGSAKARADSQPTAAKLTVEGAALQPAAAKTAAEAELHPQKARADSQPAANFAEEGTALQPVAAKTAAEGELNRLRDGAASPAHAWLPKAEVVKGRSAKPTVEMEARADSQPTASRADSQPTAAIFTQEGTALRPAAAKIATEGELNLRRDGVAIQAEAAKERSAKPKVEMEDRRFQSRGAAGGVLNDPHPEARTTSASRSVPTRGASREAWGAISERFACAEDELARERQRARQARHQCDELAASRRNARADLRDAELTQAKLQVRLRAMEGALRECEADAWQEASEVSLLVAEAIRRRGGSACKARGKPGVPARGAKRGLRGLEPAVVSPLVNAALCRRG